MRPLEILLVVAELVAFLVLVVQLPPEARWMRHAALAPLPIAVAQVLVEGPRWQMVPAYVLAGLFFLVWLLQTVAPASLPAGRSTAERVATGLAAGLGALALAVSVLLPVLIPVFRFPPPGGPYEIGTVTYHWVDAARPEVFTADPADRREVMVQIWYPARGSRAAPRAPWVEDADALAPALGRLTHLPGFVYGHLKYVTSHALRSAPVADGEPRYPVLLFLPGLTGFRQMNTFQVEELVSRGYVVAAIDQPYTAAAVVFPDGRRVDGWSTSRLVPPIGQSLIPGDGAPAPDGQAIEDGFGPQDGIIPFLAGDVVFTLDRLAALNQDDPDGILTGRLDLQRAGVFGVSLGGIVGGEACRLEPRIRACLVMDAPLPADVVEAGLRQPTMWISRDADTMRLEGWAETGPQGVEIHQTTMRAVYEALPGDGYLVPVPGMFHLNLTDFPLLTPLAPRLGLTGPIDAGRAHRIVNAYSLAFFDRHLKGLPEPLLDGPGADDLEVRFESRRPSSTPVGDSSPDGEAPARRS